MSYAYGTGVNANYSGRVLVYPDLVPFDTDFLRSDQYRMVDVSLLAQTILGLPTSIGGNFVGLGSGLCTQNAAPDMTVEIGVCAVYYPQAMESIAYGNLGTISLPVLYKQFINMVAFNSGTLAGGTFANAGAGNWKYYLIQGTPQTSQVNSVNRPYYNAANPPVPNYMAQDDTEIDRIVFTVVAGAESSKAGALPALPAVSAGAVGMFLVLVDDVVAAITNSLISYFPGTFIPETLNTKISEATGDARYLQLSNLAAPQIDVLSGAGNYAHPAGALYLTAEGVGAGGGGAGSGGAGVASGSDGGDTTFGALTGHGGVGGGTSGDGDGAGGTATGGDLNYTGVNGGKGGNVTSSSGGAGGGSKFGEGAPGAPAQTGGATGGSSSIPGGGGGGASCDAATNAGDGGGGGGYFYKIIANPTSPIAYSVGAGGALGGAGALGASGGNGEDGTIVVTAYFQ